MHRKSAAPRRFHQRLYLRIWLALLGGLLLTALLAVGAWRLVGNREIPREIALSDSAGREAGRARLDYRSAPGSVRIELDDGRVLFARWRDNAATRAAPGFVGWLLLIVVAVGIASYPVARRLTHRLEQLRKGVDALGDGDLSARVPVRGHDEIAALATRFNHAAARIETLVAAQQGMLANASHELRSPLARIRMALEVAGHGDRALADQEIARNVVELDALIEEILLASRLEARTTPEEPFEPIDLTALAAEECARGGVALDAEGVLLVDGNARLLRRALRNLIENALRHGGSNSQVEVTLRSEPSPTGSLPVSLAVCDRGPGVPPSERERIFEPFYRLRGASEATGGTGLGLALVRTITSKHDGVVHCEDRTGGGACFRLRLPAATPPAAPGI